VFGCIEAPPSSSRLTAAFASQLLLPTCLAKRVSLPPRGLGSARTRAVPSVAFSSTASNVHHARPSFIPTRLRPELAQREHRHMLHAATLHVVALLVNALHSSSCCRARTRLGLAASLPRSHTRVRVTWAYSCLGRATRARASTAPPASSARAPLHTCTRHRLPLRYRAHARATRSASLTNRSSCACPLTRACSRCCYSTHAPRLLRSSTSMHLDKVRLVAAALLCRLT
jgi:hypothetical protein